VRVVPWSGFEPPTRGFSIPPLEIKKPRVSEGLRGTFYRTVTVLSQFFLDLIYIKESVGLFHYNYGANLKADSGID